jgi:hypothetical protein
MNEFPVKYWMKLEDQTEDWRCDRLRAAKAYHTPPGW